MKNKITPTIQISNLSNEKLKAVMQQPVVCCTDPFPPLRCQWSDPQRPKPTSCHRGWSSASSQASPACDEIRNQYTGLIQAQWYYHATHTDWPREAADTHQFLYVPQADQGISTSCGEVFPRGVKLDADAVGRVSVDGLDGLQLRITANTHTVQQRTHTSTDAPTERCVWFIILNVQDRGAHTRVACMWIK